MIVLYQGKRYTAAPYTDRDLWEARMVHNAREASQPEQDQPDLDRIRDIKNAIHNGEFKLQEMKS